ncbi:MAG: DASS family sodium-coupled anion symporter [Chlamydiia bacterium]|nr:DASS family sodium-coupled anion symporter [Chlamydiia bacterium]
MIQKKIATFLLPPLIGIAIWFSPTPDGVMNDAWHLFAIFIATILGVILKPFPMGVIAFFGLTATVLFHVLTFEQACSGFSNDVVWLVVFAFFIARGFIKSGLGDRIAYRIMSLIGKNSIGLGYGLVATDLLIAPMIPSLVARGGGVVFPLLKSLADVFTGSSHDPRMGAFLTLSAFQGTVITSAMFLTSMAGNPLIVQYAKSYGISITWGSWAAAAIVPGLISLAVVPYCIYQLVRPTIRRTPHARDMALKRLKEMGPLKWQEWVMLGTFLLMITLWILGDKIQLKAAVSAMLGLSLLLISGVLRWKDLLEEYSAWDTFIWFSALITLPRFLAEFGFTTWFGNSIVSSMIGLNWLAGFALLCLLYFYFHYFFASNVGHITALYVPFLVMAISLGAAPEFAALALGFLSSLFGGLTHYGSGPAPIFFGTGFVTVGEWWKIGAIVSLLNIFIWTCFGGLWWKFLGLW